MVNGCPLVLAVDTEKESGQCRSQKLVKEKHCKLVSYQNHSVCSRVREFIAEDNISMKIQLSCQLPPESFPLYVITHTSVVYSRLPVVPGTVELFTGDRWHYGRVP